MEISDFFCNSNTNVFDIGSTSGSFINSLYERHKNKEISFNGIEISSSMFNQSLLRYPNINFVNEDMRDCNLNNSSFITAYYTIQFINPQFGRIYLIKYITLNWAEHYYYLKR